MEEKEFCKIAKELSGYKKMIETLASMDLTLYNDGALYWGKGIFSFDEVRYLNDNFSSDKIRKEDGAFKMKVSDEVELVMSLDDLEKELSTCRNTFYEIMHGITVYNLLRESGKTGQELEKLNNKLYDVKVEFVLSAEALFEKFVIGAREVRSEW